FIGGLATITGSIMGAVFVVLLPKLVNWLTGFIPGAGGVGQGGLLNVFELQSIIFGLLIILFLILEPRGLYGLWLRLRNYFKAWPFSY
ncbi:MAG: branched-chain amino acid ABC transporter permease, partial [Actinomycetota bacterium]